MSHINAIELSLFAARIEAVCDEMGAQLRRAAFSPNIRDRLDFSCAVFDAQGRLCAQAAHIPVHLGSMAYAMAQIVDQVAWRPGDMLILNDPYLGGTHLPDITLIAPVFVQEELLGFVVNRAHHADIGTQSPGSMPLSRSLDEEGILIPPQHLLREDTVDEVCLQRLIGATRNPRDAAGDFAAQIGANRYARQRLGALIAQGGVAAYRASVQALNAYGERLAAQAFADLPQGRYVFEDVMDDDGQGQQDIPIRVAIEIAAHTIDVDFSGSAAQVQGNINCPLSVTAAAVFYVFRCLMPAHTPACAGSFRAIRLHAPLGSLLNARRPAAVAAGNVETSTRVVDVVMGALAQAIPARIPAASQGSMNNLAMGGTGDEAWGYYETLGGGMGAGAWGGGLSAVQTHMTNTRNTPIEVLEMRYPVRVRRYALRPQSGGLGRRRGGDGLIREYEFLRPAVFTLLSERRVHAAWGSQGGAAGAVGVNQLDGVVLAGKCTREVGAGARLLLQTPGGGGWGDPSMALTDDELGAVS